MASHGRDHDHDALWGKLWELELQLAAYKLLPPCQSYRLFRRRRRRWAETPARARKRWGSLEGPSPAIFSAAATNPHMDLAKGLRKLLSFVRKSKSGERQHGRDSGAGKPVKGWPGEATACSGLDGPFDRARLEGHRFPMIRAVGTSR